VEDQLRDYSTRYKALRHRQAYLLTVAQPKARDEADEEERDNLAATEGLQARRTAAHRSLETAKSELAAADALKMQLRQSLTTILQ